NSPGLAALYSAGRRPRRSRRFWASAGKRRVILVIVRREVGHRLSPILRTVIDVQDFDGFGFQRVDHDVGEWRKRQFSCAVPMAGSASVGCGLKRADSLVNRPHGRFRKVRIVRVEIILDAFQVFGGGNSPTNAHQGFLNMRSMRASISSSSMKSPRSAAAIPLSTAARNRASSSRYRTRTQLTNTWAVAPALAGICGC